MSCRTTKGGSLSLRLARIYSGLSDSACQALFHSLKREGALLPAPTQEDRDDWEWRQRSLIKNADLTPAQLTRAEHDLLRAGTEEPDGGTFYAWNRIEVRARQEAVIRSVSENVVDIAPPGSQEDQYELDEEGRPTRVWYASYGSNLSRDRFLTYLEGGKPEGSNTYHGGARDKSEPAGDIPIRFNGRMHFAYSSSRWGYGGVAFMDFDKAGHALGRAYNITAEQFDDVVAQENGRSTVNATTPPQKIDIMKAVKDGELDVNETSIYGRMIHIGDYEGAPVLTFTGSFTAHDALIAESSIEASSLYCRNEPHNNYVRMVGSGLEETFGMNEHQQADYIRGCAGAEDIGRRKILNTLRTPAEEIKRKTSSWDSDPTWSSWSKTRPSGGLGGSYSWDRDWDRDYPYDKEKEVDSIYDEYPSMFDEQANQDQWFRDLRREEPKQATLPGFRLPAKRCVICSKTGHDMHTCPTWRPQGKAK